MSKGALRRSCALWAVLLAPFLPLASAARAPVQDGADQAEAAAETELDRLLRLSREGAPVVRPQAAEELVRLGPPAAERLLEVAGATNAELAKLGRELVAALGKLDEPRLRARLWSALADPDFPWRPQAAQTLAENARGDEAQRLVALAKDPLAAVRTASIEAIVRLDLRDEAPLLEELLVDPDDRVRRLAATALDRFGARWALLWLVEDLRRDDRFFQQRTGMTARFDAARLLAERLGGDLGFNPGSAPQDEAAREAVARLEERVAELAGSELRALPDVARAATLEGEPVLGIEIRSCRLGEYFLRWTAQDELWVGVGNATRIPLPEGTTARLLGASAVVTAELGPRGAFGEPGCDLEQLHLVQAPNGRPTTFRVSKGPDPLVDLRPPVLGRYYQLLVESIPGEATAPGVQNLRAAVAEALKAVGGPLSSKR